LKTQTPEPFPGDNVQIFKFFPFSPYTEKGAEGGKLMPFQNQKCH
jgi:hypothetical protein